jgi:hypothetical protein
MALTTGQVVSLKVQQSPVSSDTIDFASVTLRTVDGGIEYFLIWQTSPYDRVPFSNWIARSLNVSLLREALVNKLQVSILHGDTSSFVENVEVEEAE